ncbi:MAG: DUF4249 family protein, partial [bacterium]
MKSWHLPHTQLWLGFILFSFNLVSCNRMPSGPNIPDEPKLAVFCVLDPAQQTQTMLVQRTLTFEETQAGSNAVDVSDARIILSGPDGEFVALPMLPGTRPSDPQIIKYGTDFLAGSGHFNYLLEGEPIQTGTNYQLSIATEEYGSIQAATTVPGAFEITEVNIEPELSSEPNLDEELSSVRDFRLIWTESPGAAGYLVDIVVLVYDFSEWVQTMAWSHGDTTWQMREFVFQDSVDFLDIPYEEIPLTFRTAHGTSRRGFLTRDLIYETSLVDIMAKIGLMRGIRNSTLDPLTGLFMFQLKVTIHALSKSMFDFTTFQYLRFNEGQVIGQEVVVPDISNIKGGVGVFGAAVASTAYSRINLGYAAGPPALEPEYVESPWEQHLLDDVPQNLQPDSGTILAPNDSLVLSWDPVPQATAYVLVLKPHYLWFFPGNHAYLLRTNHLEIFERFIPYRDCRIEWYVKAIDEVEYEEFAWYLSLWYEWARDKGVVFMEDSTAVFAVGPGKGPLVLYGYYLYEEGIRGRRGNSGAGLGFGNDGYPHTVSRWSESKFIYLPSGEMAGFEDRQPVPTVPAEGAQLSTTGTLKWQAVAGADAYLVYIRSDQQTGIAVSRETEISPPFPDESEWVDGLHGLGAFESGAIYTWQVCALRVKSGALGFVVDEPRNGHPPTVYPRYQHPSGIILQSQWSEPRTFVA